MQAKHWDPVLAWAHDALGARFILAEGVDARGAARRASRRRRARSRTISGGLAPPTSMTTLTGSALIALALDAGFLDADAAWAAAHVDEDWQMSLWGHDEIALKRRAFRWREMQAASLVLA